MFEPETNVVPFHSRAGAPARQPAHLPPRSLVERVYAAGSLAVRADDVAAKTAAAMLQALGLLVVEEVLADGTLRPLPRGRAREAMDRPWRLVKPAYSGTAGVPDGHAV